MYLSDPLITVQQHLFEPIVDRAMAIYEWKDCLLRRVFSIVVFGLVLAPAITFILAGASVQLLHEPPPPGALPGAQLIGFVDGMGLALMMSFAFGCAAYFGGRRPTT